MTMFKTKYPNNSRLVSGNVQLFNDDVVLLCDTSVGAVNIDLLEIADGFWSTQWKLYILDSSNNASVNNVTINAGAGQTINAESFVTINISGGTAMIEITGDSQFLATFSSSIPPLASGHIIQDESIDLPNQPKLNFIGAGVRAFDNPVNNSTDVEVLGGIQNLTNAEMLDLMSTSTVVESQLYRITDALDTFGGIIVIGVSDNNISREGRSFHLNADYQGVGDYSGVPSYTGFYGIWNTFTISYSLGSVVIYNGIQYVSIGPTSPGDSPQTHPAQWEELTRFYEQPYRNVYDYVSTNGYIFEVDFSLYDVYTNQLLKRSDKYNNVVEYAENKGQETLKDFPWGNEKFTNNKIQGTVTVLQGLNNQDIFFRNNIVDDGLFTITNGSREFPPTFEGNIIQATGIINCGATGVSGWTGAVQDNIVSGNITVNNVPDIYVYQNTVTNGSSLQFSDGIAITTTDKLIVRNNNISGGAKVLVKNLDTSDFDRRFSENDIQNTGTLNIDGWSDLAVFEKNFINTTLRWEIINLTNNATQGGDNDKLIDKVISTFPIVIDFADSSIYNAGVLDLNPTALLNEYNYVGRFLCINSVGTNITSINNAQETGTPFSLSPYSTGAPNLITLTYTPVATALVREIIENSAYASQTIFNYYDVTSEEITLLNKGDKFFVQSYKKWL